MDELIPIYRVERFLDAIVNGNENPYAPISPIECYLAKIAGQSVEIPAPISRADRYLAQLCGEDVVVPEPVSRIDHYLAAICGEDVVVPEPVSRIEYWLAKWAEGGGTIATVTGSSPLALANALAHSIKSLVQTGLCAQASTPTPSSPVDIKCNNGTLKWDGVNQRIYADGTPEVLTVLGKNLLNPATNVQGSYISASGVITADTGSPPKSQYTALIPVVAGEKYTWSLISNRASSGNNRWHGYDESGEWVQQIAFDPAETGGAAFTLTATIPSGVSYVRLSYGATDSDAQFELGESATEYAAFSAQTASVENLFSVGTYKDEQDIITGAVTRRVGIKVFDGTESWTTDTYGGNRRFVTRNLAKEQLSTVVCTHYSSTVDDSERTSPGNAYVAATGALVIYRASTQSIDTVEDWTAYLAAQYAAGTPVIVLYLLATETTETVTPQPLDTTAGGNTVIVTAEVSPIALAVEYATAAA